MLLLNDEEEEFLAKVTDFVLELESQVIQGKDYWTNEELETLIVNTLGDEAWEFRKGMQADYEKIKSGGY